MASVSTYLNFDGRTEEAFEFYRTVFGGNYEGDVNRFGDMPADDNMPPLPDEAKDQVLHVCLPILGGFKLMGSDAPNCMGFQVHMGNNMHINLETDSREQTDELFAALSDGGTITMPLQDMFWGAYFGSCTDKFGVQWMFNFDNSKMQ